MKTIKRAILSVVLVLFMVAVGDELCGNPSCQTCYP